MRHSSFSLAAGALVVLFGNSMRGEEAAKSEPDKTGLFKQIDANGDGQISEDEVPEAKRRLFGRLLRRGDSNGDGKLTAEEFAKAMQDERPEAPPAGAGQAGDQYLRFLQADPQDAFKRLDANGDGKIELTEVPEQARGRLQQFLDYFDANADKALSLEEFRKGHEMLRTQAGIVQPPRPPMPAGLLKVLDTNGDGMLSKEEIAAAPESLGKLDLDGDGAISARELLAVLPASGPAAAPPGTKLPEGNQRPDVARLLERLRSLDQDGDGKWSESELPPFLRQQFEKIDGNGDKFVDVEELKQALALLRRQQK